MRPRAGLTLFSFRHKRLRKWPHLRQRLQAVTRCNQSPWQWPRRRLQLLLQRRPTAILAISDCPHRNQRLCRLRRLWQAETPHERKLLVRCWCSTPSPSRRADIWLFLKAIARVNLQPVLPDVPARAPGQKLRSVIPAIVARRQIFTLRLRQRKSLVTQWSHPRRLRLHVRSHRIKLSRRATALTRGSSECADIIPCGSVCRTSPRPLEAGASALRS